MFVYDALSSSQSTSSGASTNPNTPQAEDLNELDSNRSRLEESAILPTIFATPPSHPTTFGTMIEPYSPREAAELNMNSVYGQRSGQPPVCASSSFEASNGQQDIRYTPPREFRVSNVDAVVCSQLDSDLRLQFSLDWVPGQDGAAAFFKFRQKVHLSDLTNFPLGRDGLVNIFVYIPPDRVRRLTYNPLPRQRPLGSNTISLSFDMADPPALVFPKAHVPTQAAQDPIANLHKLASQLSFTVFVNISTRMLPAAQIQLLCAEVSAQRVSNLEQLGFRTVPTLYSGQGGQVLEGAEVLAPPAYDDVAKIPGAHTASSSHKRRRRDSIGSSIPSETIPMNSPTFEKLLNARLATECQAIRDMHDDFKASMMKLLNEHKSDVLDIVAKHKIEILNAMGSSEVRVSNAVIDGVSDVIDERISKGQEELQDSIMERITSMPLRAELTFPEHPLY